MELAGGSSLLADGPAVAAFADVPGPVLYALLRLRSEVFVVEQRCVYLDLDGRDVEPTTRHLWFTDDGGDGGVVRVIGAARLLVEPDGASVGRVVSAPSHRRRGVGAALVRAALELAPGTVRIHAQSHLQAWYSGFGFAVAGPEFLEDGIPHVPMVRT